MVSGWRVLVYEWMMGESGRGGIRGSRPRSEGILPISRANTFALRSDCCRGCWPISALDMAHCAEAMLNWRC